MGTQTVVPGRSAYWAGLRWVTFLAVRCREAGFIISTQPRIATENRGAYMPRFHFLTTPRIDNANPIIRKRPITYQIRSLQAFQGHTLTSCNRFRSTRLPSSLPPGGRNLLPPRPRCCCFGGGRSHVSPWNCFSPLPPHFLAPRRARCSASRLCPATFTPPPGL